MAERGPAGPGLPEAYAELERLGVEVVSHHFRRQTALSRADGLLAIDYGKIKGDADELAVLLHEIGHFTAGAFYPASAPHAQRQRAEERAERRAFEGMYPPSLLAAEMRRGYTEPWQLAERLGLPEEFLLEMLAFYRDVRGVDFNLLGTYGTCGAAMDDVGTVAACPASGAHGTTGEEGSLLLFLSADATGEEAVAAAEAILASRCNAE